MGRYLLFLSYIGSAFSGVQKQNKFHVKTISGILEEALAALKPTNYIDVVFSSRTDKNVHALCNTAHVDLLPRKGKPFEPEFIAEHLNKAMCDRECSIRILKVLRVSDTFHSRFNAIKRAYLYRVAFARDPQLSWNLPFLPTEQGRTLLVYKAPVDMKRIFDAAEILQGKHNFSAFTSTRALIKDGDRNPNKYMNIQITRSSSFFDEYSPLQQEHFDYWDFFFVSRSFLYHQIRMMMAILIEAGHGNISLEQVQWMIDQPLDAALSQIINLYPPASPDALYLAGVDYRPQDLVFDESASSTNCENNVLNSCDDDELG